MTDDPQDLLRLADSVEKATGPDRQLDMTIKAAVYGAVCLMSPFNGEWCLYRPGTDDARGGKAFERPRSVSHEVWQNDRYTASLDAVMTLVPEGMFHILWGHRSRSDSRPAATVGDEIGKHETSLVMSLCAAALRARAHSTKDSSNG